MTQKQRIEELERKVQELESRPMPPIRIIVEPAKAESIRYLPDRYPPYSPYYPMGTFGGGTAVSFTNITGGVQS